MKMLLLVLQLLPNCVWNFSSTQSPPLRQATSIPPLAQQLTAYLNEPTQPPHRSTVIHFKLNNKNQLTQIEVRQGNERSKADLIRLLKGKRVLISPAARQKYYTVRLHF